MAIDLGNLVATRLMEQQRLREEQQREAERYSAGQWMDWHKQNEADKASEFDRNLKMAQLKGEQDQALGKQPTVSYDDPRLSMAQGLGAGQAEISNRQTIASRQAANDLETRKFTNTNAEKDLDRASREHMLGDTLTSLENRAAWQNDAHVKAARASASGKAPGQYDPKYNPWSKVVNDYEKEIGSISASLARAFDPNLAKRQAELQKMREHAHQMMFLWATDPRLAPMNDAGQVQTGQSVPAAGDQPNQSPNPMSGDDIINSILQSGQ